ncbi:MAG: hypothetical protein ABI867_30335 [Kofleriaceae bacterium]
MRTVVQLSVLVAFVLAASPARADGVIGTYDVKFDEVSTNCQSPLRYPHGKLTIAVKGTRLTVDVDRTPLMNGVPAKNGAVNAKSKQSSTMVEGMLGTFSVAGRVTPEGQLQLVMVGEYSANGKSLCTQSWNVTGPRSSAVPEPPKKKASLPPVHGAQHTTVVRDLEHVARIGR